MGGSEACAPVVDDNTRQPDSPGSTTTRYFRPGGDWTQSARRASAEGGQSLTHDRPAPGSRVMKSITGRPASDSKVARPPFGNHALFGLAECNSPPGSVPDIEGPRRCADASRIGLAEPIEPRRKLARRQPHRPLHTQPFGCRKTGSCYLVPRDRGIAANVRYRLPWRPSPSGRRRNYNQ